MRWFHFTVEEFENTTNPNNAEIIIMNRRRGNPKFSTATASERSSSYYFSLEESARKSLKLPSADQEGHNSQYMAVAENNIAIY